MSSLPSAVLFDFDGTLWDSESVVFGVFRDLYHEHGLELSLETWSAAIGTVGAFDAYATLDERAGGGLDLPRIRAVTEERIHSECRKAPLRPGVGAFMHRLDEAGVARALVSSDRSAWLVSHLDRLGWPDGWAAMVCADGVASHAKPNPHLYVAALEVLEVPASRAFAIEDSPNGIRAAKAAGLPCVCIPNAVTASLDLSEADVTFPSFEGLTIEDVWRSLRPS